MRYDFLMRRRLQLNILTLVGAFALAAARAGASPLPIEAIDDEASEASAAPAPAPHDLEREGLVAPAPSPIGAVEPTSPPFRYRRRWSLAPRIGGGFDSRESSEKNATLFEAGAQLEFPAASGASWLALADVLSNGRGDIAATRLFRFSRSSFRPFATAGIGLEVAPDDALAAFLKFENVQLRGSAGVDWTLARDLSARLEAEAALSGRAQRALGSLGCVVSW